MEPVRIQKWLSQMGLHSRREAERMISSGRVSVNGAIVELGAKVQPGVDAVAIDGVEVEKKARTHGYWMINKPDAIIVSRNAERPDRKTVFDLDPVKQLGLIFPVGRLDFRTEGLLLLSNDGEWVNRLSHPRYKVSRTYDVLSSARLPETALKTIRKGFRLEDGPIKDVKIDFSHGQKLGATSGAWYRITIHQGRNRIVRRIFEYFNVRAVRLIRVAYGDLWLPPTLKPGRVRRLSTQELALFKTKVATVH